MRFVGKPRACVRSQRLLGARGDQGWRSSVGVLCAEGGCAGSKGQGSDNAHADRLSVGSTRRATHARPAQVLAAEASTVNARSPRGVATVRDHRGMERAHPGLLGALSPPEIRQRERSPTPFDDVTETRVRRPSAATRPDLQAVGGMTALRERPGRDTGSRTYTISNPAAVISLACLLGARLTDPRAAHSISECTNAHSATVGTCLDLRPALMPTTRASPLKRPSITRGYRALDAGNRR